MRPIQPVEKTWYGKPDESPEKTGRSGGSNGEKKPGGDSGKQPEGADQDDDTDENDRENEESDEDDSSNFLKKGPQTAQELERLLPTNREASRLARMGPF